MTQYKFTPARIERQSDEHRENGRYAKMYPCEICGKGSGANYATLDCYNETGLGFVVCNRCAKKIYKGEMTEAQAVEIMKARRQ